MVNFTAVPPVLLLDLFGKEKQIFHFSFHIGKSSYICNLWFCLKVLISFFNKKDCCV